MWVVHRCKHVVASQGGCTSWKLCLQAGAAPPPPHLLEAGHQLLVGLALPACRGRAAAASSDSQQRSALRRLPAGGGGGSQQSAAAVCSQRQRRGRGRSALWQAGARSPGAANTDADAGRARPPTQPSPHQGRKPRSLTTLPSCRYCGLMISTRPSLRRQEGSKSKSRERGNGARAGVGTPTAAAAGRCLVRACASRLAPRASQPAAHAAHDPWHDSERRRALTCGPLQSCGPPPASPPWGRAPPPGARPPRPPPRRRRPGCARSAGPPGRAAP